MATESKPARRASSSAARAAASSKGSGSPPSGADAAGHLEDPRVQRARLAHLEIEELRALLGADLEHVAEAAVGDQQRGRAAPLEQRVGGHRGAEAARGRAAAARPARRRRPAPGWRGCPPPAPRPRRAAWRCGALPSGATPMQSVKVPPRSIENSQLTCRRERRAGRPPGACRRGAPDAD